VPELAMERVSDSIAANVSAHRNHRTDVERADRR
jgi:hypothetical protein